MKDDVGARDAEYMEIIVERVRVCASYKPKFGRGGRDGLTLRQFQDLYGADPFYAWFGLDNAMLYAAHKASGGMTSVYRQIGIGCERVFRRILADQFGLSAEDASWSYEVPSASGRTRKLSLDGRVPLSQVREVADRARVRRWMRRSSQAAGVDPKVLRSLSGVVFEVRQGYKSRDSKRQNADIANAASAYVKSYLACAVVLSKQIDEDVLRRYRDSRWVVLTGTIGSDDPLTSTYDFMRDVVGYDMAGFFERNAENLRAEIAHVLATLLDPESPRRG